MIEATSLDQYRFIRRKKSREKKPRTDYEKRYRYLTEKIRIAKHPSVKAYYEALRDDLRLSKYERAGTKKAGERKQQIEKLKVAYDEYCNRYRTRNGGAPSTKTGPRDVLDFRDMAE